MALNLHLLRLFATVARHGSFSRAAEALHISQPAVSKGVREFEAQVGTPLLERGPGGIRTTEAGAVLLRHARTLFAAERAAEDDLAALRGLAGGTLRIGASTTVATYFLPPLLGAFHWMHPAVELRLTSANTLAIADLMAEGELDSALVEGPVERTSLVAQPWREDVLVAVAAPAHPLASRGGPVAPMALAGEIVIVREPGSGTRDVVWNAFALAGLAPQRVLEVGSNEAMVQVVAAGLGVAVVSSAVAADQIALGRIVVLEVEGFSVRRRLTRLSVPGRQASPAAAAFDRLLDTDATDAAPTGGS